MNASLLLGQICLRLIGIQHPDLLSGSITQINNVLPHWEHLIDGKIRLTAESGICSRWASVSHKSITRYRRGFFVSCSKVVPRKPGPFANSLLHAPPGPYASSNWPWAFSLTTNSQTISIMLDRSLYQLASKL